jgi:hypothetical protein
MGLFRCFHCAIGFRRGLLGVQSGGRRLIIVPSKYGFGDATNIDRIPADSTLIIGRFQVNVGTIYSYASPGRLPHQISEEFQS